MTVAVGCNLADGVILGVDSAIALSDRKGGVAKVYENAEKLFQVGEKPVGIATYGLATIALRSMGGYIREFEGLDPNHVVSRPATMEDIVEQLRIFFLRLYLKEVVPELERQTGKKFEEIPQNEIPILGLAVGGFSAGAYLSEMWEVVIPFHSTPKSAIRWRGQGEFGSTWFALNETIHRYVKGYDRRLLIALKNHFGQLRGSPLSQQEENQVNSIVSQYEYVIPHDAMPLAEGISYVGFLVELVINHHRFAIGAPVVGGKARLGVVTYKADKFQILEEGGH